MGEPWEMNDVQVLAGKWVIRDFNPDPEAWLGPYYGADWGFSQDPTAFTRSWVHNQRLYIEYESGGVRIDMDDLYPELAKIPGAQDKFPSQAVT